MADAFRPAPLLSICIPTRNRADLLRTCLSELAPVLRELPFAAEVVVCDNMSTDGTASVLDAAPVPVRIVRPATVLEPIANYFHVMRQAAGRYAHYLADDDALLPDGLAAAVDWMESHPAMVASYHPQIEVAQGSDAVLARVNDPSPVPAILTRGNYLGAIELVGPAMFHPEIPLVRSEVWRRHVVQPRKTFYGFWLLASLLAMGDVGIGTQPFYKHRLRPQGGSHPQIQWEFAVDRMDQNRLGMELLFARYLQSSGVDFAPAQRAHVAAWFNGRMAQYAQVAARICQEAGDLQAAAELMTRCALWAGTDVRTFDAASAARRARDEVARQRAAVPGLRVVDTSAERLALVGDGVPAAGVVALEDMAAALRVTV